ncbi:hypothetical protein Lalb_Chr03g0032901 [Lupinus albus]|uniref:Uncharacterized protein n=1 Tax=Lupinus albus TaxID=3870 RepID=A0A6A4QU94_LUPAL|nr:hypothetical protein Lalb_Chr03g0032901 [Lupinus albus]
MNCVYYTHVCLMKKEEVSIIEERLFKENRRDYGRYDPSPGLSKPPYKLIPDIGISTLNRMSET